MKPAEFELADLADIHDGAMDLHLVHRPCGASLGRLAGWATELDTLADLINVADSHRCVV